jgi:hypothetical protein
LILHGKITQVACAGAATATKAAINSDFFNIWSPFLSSNCSMFIQVF